MITASTSGSNDSSREEDTLTDPKTMDALGWLSKHLDDGSGNDMVRDGRGLQDVFDAFCVAAAHRGIASSSIDA